MNSFARAAGPLGLPLVGSFGFLAILGLPGAVWAARRGAAERWLIGYLALVSLAMVPFFVTDRYRHHLVPALAVLAGISIAGIGRAGRNRAGSALLGPALVVGLATGIVFAPVGTGRAGSSDWVLSLDRANRLADHGDYAGAAAAFARADALIRSVNPQRLPKDDQTSLASFYFRYGDMLDALGRREEAIVY